MTGNKLLGVILKWRIKHVNDKRFVILLSLMLGVGVGIMASLLRKLTHWIEGLIQNGVFNSFDGLLYFVLPLVGIFVVVLIVKYGANNHLPKSVSYVIFNIGNRNGIFKPIHSFMHVITSALTVAFGGSVGLEGPAVLTGSAIGSNLGQLFHLPKKRRLLLIGCGSAAAISALFNSPITGVIFVLEIILVEARVAFMIPLLIASVAGTLTSSLLVGDTALFEFPALSKTTLKDIPFYVLLALITGVLSIYFVKTSEFLTTKLGSQKNPFKRFLVNGGLLGVALFLVPSLYGEGFFTIRKILSGQENSLLENTFYESFFSGSDLLSNPWMILAFLAVSVILKVFATNFTKLAGGNGGVFAPSLFIGGLTGFVFSRTINELDILRFKLSETNFTLVGMAGIIAGIMHAPLTAIFLIAEITQGYELFIPLMIVVAISFATSQKNSAYSFYTKKLAEKGELAAYDKDHSLLSEIGVLKVIEKDLKTVNENGTLKDLVDTISESTRNIFPVINDSGELKGIILLDDVRHLIFNPEKYNISLKHITHDSPAYVNHDEKMDAVMAKFDKCGAWNLPVLKKGKYYGYLSKSKIFSVYRDQLHCADEESY
jgi:CIC family chloride channel protein